MQLFDADAGPRRVSLVKLSSEVAKGMAGIGRFAVEGEVVRPSVHPGGTWFTLKDRASQVTVRCPIRYITRCRVVAGERVQVTGALSWQHDKGQVVLLAEEVVPVGAGAVAAMLAGVQARLAADGLLDRRRRPLPRLPAVIGVVCGREAAVRADIESVVAARFPGYPVRFVETAVAGPGAAEAVAEAMARLDADREVEVIILARGGGDATQLLPFSDETLCRAVAAARTPVVSAIGHDGDRPLVDLVADLRCGTPSIAAARVVPDRAALHDLLDGLAATAARHAGDRARRAAERLAARDPADALQDGLQRAARRCERAADRLAGAHPSGRLPGAAARLTAARRHLDALDPVRVLERGYAVVRDASGAVVRDAATLAPGDRVRLQLAAGHAAATIDRPTIDEVHQ